MSKKDKKKLTPIDFDAGIGSIVPATQEAYKTNSIDEKVKKTEREALSVFKKVFGKQLDDDLSENKNFPTDDEVFIFVVQYFYTEKEYTRRDVDNMAKTILDLLKGRFYKDDSQVKTLLVGKKIEKRVPKDFAYIAIKKISKTQDVDAMKISGIERSVTMFQELKSKNLI